MPVEVILPRVDMDMASGKISKWHVSEGDAVRKGGLIFEIETDKAAMEVEAPETGIIRNIAIAEGVTVPVGSVVAFIYAAGEKVQSPASPAVAPPPALSQPTPSEPAPQPNAKPGSSLPGRPRATPLARRLARQGSVALEGIIGSGPDGRILAEDVRRLSDRTIPPPPVAALADEAVLKLYEPGTFDLVPHPPMRRVIAQRLVQSKQTVPHFYLTVTCDLENLLAIRKKLNAHAARGAAAPPPRLSVNDFIIKALALALQRVPAANVTWSEAGLLRHRRSDVGVAVAVEGGLFTPVIRAAETKSLSRISSEMKDLAGRARARKLAPSNYQGGSTAVSNLGMYGVEQFAAIINPPQATILAVGVGSERPAAVGGTLAIRTQMTCTLSCDHRAVDGAVGAELLAAFRAFIEEPALMLA